MGDFLKERKISKLLQNEEAPSLRKHCDDEIKQTRLID
jgi:hypothetical protein